MAAVAQPAPKNIEVLYPKIRSSVLRILSKKLSAASSGTVSPTLEDEAVNAVIMEYLEWIGLRHTANIFRRETNIPFPDLMSKEHDLSNLIRARLKSSPVDSELPIIFALIHNAKTQNHP